MSFFDMPAGCTDADLEVAELEREGNRRARMLRWATDEQRDELEAGRTVLATFYVRDAGSAEHDRPYTGRVRLELPEYELSYSVDGHGWHSTRKAARLAAEAARSC